MRLRRAYWGWKRLGLTSVCTLAFVRLACGQLPEEWEVSAAGNWTVNDNGWRIDEVGAGESWICFCPLDSIDDNLGLSARFHWSQPFAGSSQNFSRIHLIPRPEGDWNTATDPPFLVSDWESSTEIGPNSFLHLGESGSADSLRWMRTTLEGTTVPIATSHLPGQQGQIEHWIEWHQFSESDSATLQISASTDPFQWAHVMEGDANFTPECIGFSVKYTSSHANDFRIEVASFGPFVVDSIPPLFLGFNWLGNQVLEFEFNEPLSTELGFGIWPNGDTLFFAPEIQKSNKRVGLLSAPLAIGEPRMLMLHEIYDIHGNSAALDPIQILKTSSEAIPPHQMQFTEIMSDPTPAISWPEQEWIEVRNRSSQFHSVQDFYLLDGSSELLVTFEPLLPWNGLLPPGECVILSESETAIGADTVRQAIGSPWPGLNNAGESLTLIGSDGSVADFIHYDQSWMQDQMGGGTSLQISDWNACNGESNWGPSLEANGASPGYQAAQENEGTSNFSPLTLKHVIPTSAATGKLVFDQPLNTFSDIALSGPQRGRVLYDATNDSCILWQMLELNADQAVSFSVTGVVPCSPKACSLSKWTVDYVPHRFPEFQDLIITEIAHAPQGLTEHWGSFVEIANIHETEGIELGGLQCNEVTLSERFILLPGERFSFENVSLPNASGTVSLITSSNVLIDEVSYSDCWHRDRTDENSGKSLVRLHLDRGLHGHYNWNSSEDSRGCSPNSSDPAEANVAFETAPIACGIFDNKWTIAFDGPTEISSPLWNPLLLEDIGNEAHAIEANQIWHGPSQFEPLTDSISQMTWPAASISIASLCPPSPTVAVETPCDFVLNEVQQLKLNGPEPFLEISQSEYDWLSTNGIRFTSTTLPNPIDWMSLEPSITWFIPKNNPLAFSTCPSRLSQHHGRIVPLDLPSLWGEREVQLARLGTPIDRLLLHAEQESPWSTWQHLRSIERVQDEEEAHLNCTPYIAEWRSSLDPLGATPGKFNSWQHPLQVGNFKNAGITVINDTWGLARNSAAIDPIRIVLKAPQTGTWEVHLSIMNASGRVIDMLEQHSTWLAPGQEKAVTWNGIVEGKVPAPGTYWVSALFRSSENNRAQKYFRPVHIMPWH